MKNIYKRGRQTCRHGLTGCNEISIVTPSAGFRCIGRLVWSGGCVGWSVVCGVWVEKWCSRATMLPEII